jgi:hypothetical protein
MKLSDTLQPIVDLELQLGNEIARIDQPAGTKSTLGVVFKNPLHFREAAKLQLDESVYTWECNDPHYPKEKGFACKNSKHLVAGPLP